MLVSVTLTQFQNHSSIGEASCIFSVFSYLMKFKFCVVVTWQGHSHDFVTWRVFKGDLLGMFLDSAKTTHWLFFFFTLLMWDYFKLCTTITSIQLFPFMPLLGMHQKFPDIRYWLDSPDKTITYFFQRTFLQQLCTLPCIETNCSTPQPRLIWVCLQQPSWTLDMHRQFSQTGHSSCFSFTSWNRKKSQGERSGEYGGCGSSCTSLPLRKSAVVVAVCALALSWWRKMPRSPVFGWRWHQTLKTFGRQWCTYQSALTVCPRE